MNTNLILRGDNGNVWVNGKLLANIKSVKATVKGNFATDNFIGDKADYSIYQGWGGDGSISLTKIDSTVWKICADAYKNGIMPDIKIIGSLTNDSTGKSERTAIENVVFTQFDLLNIEAKKEITEDYSFTFSNYEVLETI